MTDISKKITPRIRTFAGDLEEHRKNRTENPENKTGSETTDSNIKTERAPAKPIEPKPTPVPKPVREEPIIVAEKTHVEKPKKIPAFHELQKSVNHIQAKPEKKKFKKTKFKKHHEKKSSNENRPNIGYDATIITDTKKNKTSLISSVISSIGLWFKEITKPKKKKAPKYTVPEASRRKGVIQKATTKTGSIFTADSETLREQIRLRQQQEKDGTHDDEPETIWSPYTDSGYSLLNAPDTTQNVKLEFKKQVKPPTEARPVIPPPPIPKVEESFDDGATELLKAREELDKKSASQQTEAVPVVEPTPKEIETEPVEDTVPVEEDNDNLPQVESDDSDSVFEKTDTNTLTVITLITIIGIVIVIIVSRLLFQFITNQITSEAVSVNTIETILNDSSIETIEINADNLSLVPSLVDNALEQITEGLVEVAIVSPAGDEVSPTYLFELLGFQANLALKQALTSSRFISIDNSNEMLLLKFVDETSVRGGLLSWEKTLANDFAEIYGISNNLEDEFQDKKISGHDVRTLKHDEKTILVYSIINENSAIIASNEAELARIIELEFNK